MTALAVPLAFPGHAGRGRPRLPGPSVARRLPGRHP
jgi:hypothetical protein